MTLKRYGHDLSSRGRQAGRLPGRVTRRAIGFWWGPGMGRGAGLYSWPLVNFPMEENAINVSILFFNFALKVFSINGFGRVNGFETES